ncbi:hypothetical protein ASJ33_07705 [Dehalococcoides mccartyi]|uniref:hypothetical protein n=1 Tax=Dehalococcoides TaxID=61434 RepID=UPI00062D34DC|nr:MULTISPECIES: hypothetical protein [Dehalococcoides]APH13048.1 hypothetical protein ASJ33_07705 [Dehalococcoides mccartyi]QYY57558.1 hypothetical protein CWV2_000774 [Dehalococcoides mccartyi]
MADNEQFKIYDDTIKRSWVDQYYTEVEHVQQRFHFFLVLMSFLIVAFVTLVINIDANPFCLPLICILIGFGFILSIYFSLISYFQTRVIMQVSEGKLCSPVAGDKRKSTEWLSEWLPDHFEYLFSPFDFNKKSPVSHTWFVPSLFALLWLFFAFLTYWIINFEILVFCFH